MMTDPISDMLTRIRNAAMVNKSMVDLPYSKIKFAIAKILEKENYLQKVESVEQGNKQVLRLTLKFDDARPVISDLKRVSKPGRRVYAKASELPTVLSNFGIAIISTPNGLMTNKEARKRRLGGEVICEIS